MKTHILLFLFFACFATSSFSQNMIAVQHGSSMTFTSRLDSAIILAQNGDFIYLPGGNVASGTNPTYINKRVNIIGCGYNSDSARATGITFLGSGLYFQSGSENSSVTGVFTTGGITITVSGLKISRCRLADMYFYAHSISGFVISENIISGQISFGGYSNVNAFFTKNIISNSIINVYSGSSIQAENNIFITPSTNVRFLEIVDNSFFQNNIFYPKIGNLSFSNVGGGNNFSNNLFVDNSNNITLPGTGTNNLFNQPLSSIFVNVNGSSWSSDQDFHILSNSPGKNFGSDGTDVGIYGTSSPFKEGGVPFNPHFQIVNIPGSTGPNGTLNINVKVKAQEN